MRISTSPIVAPGSTADPMELFVYNKHKSYVLMARLCTIGYYFSRTVAGISSALLPFVVDAHHTLATVLAVTVAITVVFDSTFKPREKWQLYSKASDMLATAEAKRMGKYDEYKGELDILMATEAAKLDRLVDLKDLLKDVDDAAQQAAAVKAVAKGR